MERSCVGASLVLAVIGTGGPWEGARGLACGKALPSIRLWGGEVVPRPLGKPCAGAQTLLSLTTGVMRGTLLPTPSAATPGGTKLCSLLCSPPLDATG